MTGIELKAILKRTGKQLNEIAALMYERQSFGTDDGYHFVLVSPYVGNHRGIA